MAPATPRKLRNRNQHAGGAPTNPPNVPASDYESDAPYAGSSTRQPATAAAAAAAPEPQPGAMGRIIDELNLTVLKRYVPSIHSCAAVAYNATVFQLHEDTWVDANTKGPLFICDQDPDISTGHPVPRSCVFVMNRNSLDNLIVDLANVAECELEDKFIMLTTSSASASGDGVVWGLYVDDADAIQASWSAIQDRCARATGE